jgi:acyl-CoA-dependent ceramide synthase
MATTTPLPNAHGAFGPTHVADVPEPKAHDVLKRRKNKSKKVEDESLMASLCTLICDHQIGMSTYKTQVARSHVY